MKLYTEEQVRKAITMATTSKYDHKLEFYSEDDVIDQLTPIQLPTDEEIWDEGKLVFNDKGRTIYTHYNTVPSWVDGAKCMRDKIQGGNK